MKLILIPVALLLAFGILGCTEDKAENLGDKVGSTVEEATETVADFATDATMVTTVTPQIKAAIIADPDLNDPANTIDVSSKNRMVYLTGHVESQALKDQAEQIAEGWLEDSAAPSDVDVVNELEVGEG